MVQGAELVCSKNKPSGAAENENSAVARARWFTAHARSTETKPSLTNSKLRVPKVAYCCFSMGKDITFLWSKTALKMQQIEIF
jgi:hypothetical protein